MASHDNSRKKRKVTHADGRTPQPSNLPVIASSSALPPPPPPPTAGMDNNQTANAPCPHEQSLKALNNDLDAMRQLVTCKICDRLLYEPYALPCGHTYCYSCLSQWLGGNAKMTCPDCRIVIRQQPTPSYLIRELVLVFVSRNELLPDGETADEHNKLVKEEAEVVAKDKANTDIRTGGLFKGRFNRARLNILGPLHDPGDGVFRCPECHWELEDGHCNSCGFELDDVDDDFSDQESDITLSDDDVDLELRDMDDEDGFQDDFAFDAQFLRERDGDPIPTAPRRWPQYRPAGAAANPLDPTDPASSDEDSDEDEYDANDTFIDDEAIHDSDGASDAETDVTTGRTTASAHPRNIHRAAPVVISDDDDEDGDVRVMRLRGPAVRAQPARRRQTPIALLSDDDSENGDETNETAPSTNQGAEESSSDSEDEGPVVRGSQRNKRSSVAVRTRRARTVSSDEESEDSEDDGASEVTAQGGFSPIDEGSGDEASEHTDYDDDVYAGQGHTGFAVPSFNPEDASVDGYDDESDDGWGTATPTSRSARPARPAPSARLETLQQRRPRHASPQYRPAPMPTPTAARPPMSYAPQPNRAVPQPPNTFGTGPTNLYTQPTHPTGSGYVRALPTQQEARAPNHPFQLGNILARINDPISTTNTASTNPSNYNRRNQQARTLPPPRPVPSENSSNYHARRGNQHFRLTGDGGSVADVRRKRALSVDSDDSRDFYV